MPWCNASVICDTCGWCASAGGQGVPYTREDQERTEAEAVRIWNEEGGKYESAYVRYLP